MNVRKIVKPHRRRVDTSDISWYMTDAEVVQHAFDRLLVYLGNHDGDKQMLEIVKNRLDEIMKRSTFSNEKPFGMK